MPFGEMLSHPFKQTDGVFFLAGKDHVPYESAPD